MNGPKNKSIIWSLLRNPTEVVKDGIYSKESDFWSFGIVCWELSKASNCPVGTRKEEVLPYNDLSDDEVSQL